MARLIVIALRLVVPVSIFRWPLAGSVISMLLDGADVILVDIIASLIGEEGGFGDTYQTTDKSLDLYYLAFEFIVSLKWELRLARYASIALFIYRLVGLVLFALTGIRVLLFIFPNLFENFFIFYVAALRFFPRLLPKTPLQLLLVLAILYIPKFAQEWVLHFQELHPWGMFKRFFLELRLPLVSLSSWPMRWRV